MKYWGARDIGLSGRENNALILYEHKNITISTDILNNKDNQPKITMDHENNETIFQSNDMKFLSNSDDSLNEDQSIVFGERLVEVLKFIMNRLMDHHHPPNNIPVNTFFKEANKYINDMDEYLLNKHVKSR